MYANNVKNKSGFTLIELMLAMGFVSVLLIAIAVTVIQIANIYNRGITLKDVNQAGRSLASELQKSINGSSVFDITLPATTATRYQPSAWGGRLCIGQYSYIWNYGKDIYNLNSSRNMYANSSNEIRFVKVIDANASYCTNTLKKVVFGDAVELMAVGEHNLAMHYFNVSTTASASDKKTGQQLYNMEFLVGTNDQQALKDDPNDSRYKVCKSPGESGSDMAYCSVSSFNIIARAGNIAE